MTQTAPPSATTEEKDPWPALFALCLGFFMILVDSTIVSVATPALIEDLNAEVNDVVWVTSAYLLAYAVPVLITGRLGDRYGPKKLYLAGLTLFTAASLWCGLTNSIEMLIVARVFQGLGASMITRRPWRSSPGSSRRPGAARRWRCGVRPRAWRLLVGPIAGGLLVDGFGWEWIFFINIPVGVIGFALAGGWAEARDQHPPLRLARGRLSAPACSCWCSASRKATSSTGAGSPERSPSGG